MKCTDCGYNTHNTGSVMCPAKGQSSKACFRLNLFIRVCRSKFKGHVKQIDTEIGSENIVICSINSSHGTSTPFKTCCIRLAQTPVTLVVDIGAKVSVLQEALYKQHFLDYLLETADRKLLTYDNTEISVKGIVRLPVSYESTILNSSHSMSQNANQAS